MLLRPSLTPSPTIGSGRIFRDKPGNLNSSNNEDNKYLSLEDASAIVGPAGLSPSKDELVLGGPKSVGSQGSLNGIIDDIVLQSRHFNRKVFTTTTIPAPGFESIIPRIKSNPNFTSKHTTTNEFMSKSLEDFLESLGMRNYIDIFKNEEIDMETLCTMTDDDLKNIGLNMFGPRKKLLNAVQKRVIGISSSSSTSTTERKERKLSNTDSSLFPPPLYISSTIKDKSDHKQPR